MPFETGLHTLLDLRWMIPGYTGGIEILARSLLNTLMRVDAARQYTVLLPSVTRYDFDLEGRHNFHLQTSDGPGYYLSKLALVLKKVLQSRSAQDDEIWIQARRTQAQIALSPSGIIYPDLYPLKNLLILPDLQHEYLPDLFSPEELENRRKYYAASFLHADHIITISEFTRQTLIESISFPPGRITVAHLGIDPHFTVPVRQPERVLKTYHLEPGSYLFFPAHTWAHKNHRTALQALGILRDEYALKPLLVCTGTPKEAHADIINLSLQLGLQDQFRFLGYCPTDDLPGLYQEAAALVFPSLFEGFGMPVVEAMSCGCPVICSNTTSLPEIGGDAALFIDPKDPKMLAGAIFKVLKDTDFRKALILKGRQQARKFSWLTFTSEVLRSLKRIDDGETRD